MHPHFYFVSFLKWIWKCVLTDCLQHKEANVKKWLYSSPFKKQWKKNLKFCFATKGRSCSESCQRFWVPDGIACSLQSPHLVSNVVGPIFPLFFHQTVIQSLWGNIYLIECSRPQWFSPIRGLDSESGISSHCNSLSLFFQMSFSKL